MPREPPDDHSADRKSLIHPGREDDGTRLKYYRALCSARSEWWDHLEGERPLELGESLFWAPRPHAKTKSAGRPKVMFKPDPISWDTVSTTMTGAKKVEDGREKTEADSWQ